MMLVLCVFHMPIIGVASKHLENYNIFPYYLVYQKLVTGNVNISWACTYTSMHTCPHALLVSF